MRALITGGSGAIGAALVAEFAPDYEVIFTYLKNAEAAAKLAAETGTTAVKLDIADREAVFKTVEKYPQFDLLVNNAGISQYKLFTDITPHDWQEMLDINLTGAFNCTQAVLPAMIRRKGGAIVNISSIWGEVGGSCEVAYSAAKAGLIGLTKALAKEVEPCGIHVSYIAPGAVQTPMNAGFTAEDLQAASVAHGGRILTPGDVAKDVAKMVRGWVSFLV
ncbi:MAG: SDR family NAD(P)-dependent oxidoreductase [Oscillospiraceae bacterium]|nr:SDR family NAD(P)-dependent oxidoreductase [Oscillospiraceae bacterium]